MKKVDLSSPSKTVPYEYFCHSCGEMRLSYYRYLTPCANCKGLILTVGHPMELNKDALKTEFYKGKKND